MPRSVAVTGKRRIDIHFFMLLNVHEARWPIRDSTGTGVGRGRESEGSTAETVRKRPERQWTAARTMEVLRRCPLAIAQRLVHCAIAVWRLLCWTESLSLSKTMSVALSDEQLGQLEAKDVTCSAQLHLPTHDLFWANLRVQLHLPPLRSLDLLSSPGRPSRHTLMMKPGLR